MFWNVYGDYPASCIEKTNRTICALLDGHEKHGNLAKQIQVNAEDSRSTHPIPRLQHGKSVLSVFAFFDVPGPHWPWKPVKMAMGVRQVHNFQEKEDKNQV